MNTIFLRLEAPMQAWGLNQQFTERPTGSHPTKSGVVGILLTALGRYSDQDARAISKSLRMAVRCDKDGIVEYDFQTVQKCLAANGKKDNRTIITRRGYIEDASFLVALQSDDEALVGELVAALQNPKSPLYLGRRGCLPSMPIFAGVGQYADLLEALCSQPIPDHLLGPKSVRVVLEAAPGQGNRVLDEIINLESYPRIYGPRYIYERELSVNGDRVCI